METMVIARRLILLVGLVHGSALMAVAQLPEPAPVVSADGSTVAPPPQPVSFPTWLQGVREEALARGISAPTVATALADITPVEQILNRDRTQAEFKETLDEYLARRIGVPTIRLGRQMRDDARRSPREGRGHVQGAAARRSSPCGGSNRTSAASAACVRSCRRWRRSRTTTVAARCSDRSCSTR